VGVFLEVPKRQIQAHKGGGDIAVGGHNIKLGRGGIREIEFFAQTQQLIWGGREAALRAPGTTDALSALAENGRCDGTVADDLIQAYEFLRRLEHRLQMINDEQTQIVPERPDEQRLFRRTDSPPLHRAEPLRRPVRRRALPRRYR